MTRRIESVRRPSVRGGRFTVVLEDGARLRLEQQVVENFGLTEGTELDEDVLARIRQANGRASAKARAVRILSAAPVSEQELRRRLQQKGEADEDAEEAVRWLSDLQLLDDRETARQLASAAARKGYGDRRIRQIFYEKGIDRALWDEALADLPAPDGALDRFLAARFRGRLPDRDETRRAVEALQRRGHRWPDIRRALDRYAAGLDAADAFDDCGISCMEDD